MSEVCKVALLSAAAAAAAAAPTAATGEGGYSYHGCLTEPAKSAKWCDFSLSHNERIAALLGQMTLEEKIGLLSPNPALGSACNDHTQGVPRLGVSPYMWLVEANTGANSACLDNGKCSTTFNGPLGMGASFNRTSWFLKGNVLGTELRAYNNIGWHRDAGGTVTEKIGLTGFGPNINQPRDPRFGRLSELPGEDPFHAGTYAAHMLAGQQEEDRNGHPKMVSFLKHFTAYSKETNRGHDTYNISMYDFFDSYLPQYKIAFDGGAMGVMCSYDAENGRPSCANDWLLNTVMRKMWNQPDAFVSTDCGAVPNLRGPPVHAPSDEAAAAFAINNGTDLEMGSDLVRTNLKSAVAAGLVKETTIDAAARRTLVPLFKAGRFDRLEDIEWAKFTADDVASSAHHRIRDEAAAQSFVLLKNERGTLPLKAGSKVAVIGPQATAKGLFSDYYGDDICPGGKSMDCVPSIYASIAAVNDGGVTTNASGCSISGISVKGFPQALAVAQAAESVVLALGIDKTVEHEGHDRTSLELPGVQAELAKAVYAMGKPTVLVLTNGGPLAIDGIRDGASAIVEAFNPAFGAPQLAKTLFGHLNRWGKLPYTIYPKDYISQVDLANYDMSKPPGRTYRYYTGKALYEFGTGLSYATFSHTCHTSGPTGTWPLKISCTVQNNCSVGGDEVLLVYHSAGSEIRAAARHPVPLKALVAFDRIHLDGGSSTAVEFSLEKSAFELVNEAGAKVLYRGSRKIIISRGNGRDVALQISI